jgi:hypothetical protein
MLAVLLYLWLGQRAALAEIGAELLIGLTLWGGRLASRRAARPGPA